MTRSTAVLGLLLATALWGCSFTWAKAAGDALNRASGLPFEAPRGPILLMGIRFFVAGLLWLLIVRRAREGWSWFSVFGGLCLGLILVGGMSLQLLGLARTSEAVSAFLTSLTVLFVPLALLVFLGRNPGLGVWFAVVMALAGVWMMTGAQAGGLGAGEVLGLACAVVFTAHLFAINYFVPRDNVWRMCAAQFVVAGAAGLVLAPVLDPGLREVGLRDLGSWLLLPGVFWNVLLLMLFPTTISFALMLACQPRLDPTRATLIYLTEPIFAGLFAWIAVGRHLPVHVVAGAGLILLANLLVEGVELARRRRVGVTI